MSLPLSVQIHMGQCLSALCSPARREAAKTKSLGKSTSNIVAIGETVRMEARVW